MSPSVKSAQIAIAMATFEPDLELLRAQLTSIRAQSLENWVCAISDDCSRPESFAATAAMVEDDPRFTLSRSRQRLGFYRNFERALSLTPETARFVALADQDDRWQPHKLATLAAAIGSAQLAYSDARIVDPGGHVISPTYWTARRPNSGDFASLLIANTVTGAASLLRRELLAWALPFPELPGQPYHDHWLALVALARGEIVYVDEPLYDYVQHRGAVLGHVGGESDRSGAGSAGEGRQQRWRQAYLYDYCRLVGMASTLKARCEPLPDRHRARALRRFLSTRRSPLGLVWLALRGARRSLGPSDTGGAERTLVAALSWYWLARARGYDPAPGSQR